MHRLLAILILPLLILPLSFAVAEGQSFRPRTDSLSQAGRPQTNQLRTLELRVLVDDRGGLGSSHQWMQALAEVGADRVVAETSRVKEPSFEETGSGSSKYLSIVGIVKNGKLHLPGGKFTIRQTTAIRNHLKKLRDDGAEVTVAEKVAFGLTAKQLVAAHDRLGAKIETSTAGQNVGDLANRLLKKSGYPLSVEGPVKLVMSNSKSTMDLELEGFSTGMALALTLRQMGLVFEPTRPQGQGVQLKVRVADEKVKNWPVGWPISDSKKNVVPKLYVKVPVQIQSIPIDQVLTQVEGRVAIPFVYDWAKLSANEIDLETTKVNFLRPGKKSSYDMLIDKVLTQVKPKLKSEVRIDELGKPFLWITTRNR